MASAAAAGPWWRALLPRAWLLVAAAAVAMTLLWVRDELVKTGCPFESVALDPGGTRPGNSYACSPCVAPAPCPSTARGVPPPGPSVASSAGGTAVAASWQAEDAGATSVFRPCRPGEEVSGSQPLPVDLVLKSFGQHSFYLLTLFRSLELLWPSYNRLVLVVDTVEEAFITALAPPHARTVVEPLGARGGGYFGQMFSNFYMDNYTASPVVALLDSDMVLQYRADWESLTHEGKLVLRYLRCPPAQRDAAATASRAPSPGPGNGAWEQEETARGCLYRAGVEHLLGVPYYGNFMVQAPLLLPRGVFAALRGWVERLHGKPFAAVMQDISAKDLAFSQHSAFGNFLLHVTQAHAAGGAHAAAVAAARVDLDGSPAAGGLVGLHFIAWGREEMFPHVGRHIGWEDEGPLKTRRDAYLPYAMEIIRKGVCASYVNADPRLCARRGGVEPGGEGAVELWRWQNYPPGPGHTGLDRYRGAVRKTCYVPPRAWQAAGAS